MYACGAGPALVQHKLNSDLASLFEWVTSSGFMVSASLCFWRGGIAITN